MKTYFDIEKDVLSLVNENENYVIVKDGKAIKQNIVEDEIEIQLVDNYDISDICDRTHTDEENEIITNSRFTTLVNIYKSSDLKVIRINDEKKTSSILFNVSRKVETNITNIYFNVDTNTKALVEVICEKSSKLNYTTVQGVYQGFSEKLNIYVAGKCELNINTLALNNDVVDNSTKIYLNSTNSIVKVNNSIINNTGKCQNYNFDVYHWNQDTTSELINYAICKNSSILNINSNGIIKNGCARSNIQQKSKGIILDLNSAISANPLLQIDEFDVVANHGASIGAIDDEDLYYLMSRGLTREDSEQLIVTGLMNPIINEIKDEKIKQYVINLIKEKI